MSPKTLYSKLTLIEKMCNNKETSRTNKKQLKGFFTAASMLKALVPIINVALLSGYGTWARAPQSSTQKLSPAVLIVPNFPTSR
ncbi:hypothetical protein L873DRAFT_1813787 [Choiromyces venosus 120613-1]|uniref:Uncharacterized protein n=1 Tax=Choiromyces venosus 120613-1 TaxID=1336337 RepID=A0A3N4JLI8_9PEZI|nr:hypothetical protein L873DRAFT_1813787 [Choiromyces venosus 120613-1]